MTKQYGAVVDYEKKLERVMARFGAGDCNYNWDRHGAWVEFRLDGELYRFEHTLTKAAQRGIKLKGGTDCFAQIVLSLEDLARMSERGIYELSTWISGMRCLPEKVELPGCLVRLGFSEMPSDAGQVRSRYRQMARAMHPDAGGDASAFTKLHEAYEQAMTMMKEEKV